MSGWSMLHSDSLLKQNRPTLEHSLFFFVYQPNGWLGECVSCPSGVVPELLLISISTGVRIKLMPGTKADSPKTHKETKQQPCLGNSDSCKYVCCFQTFGSQQSKWGVLRGFKVASTPRAFAVASGTPEIVPVLASQRSPDREQLAGGGTHKQNPPCTGIKTPANWCDLDLVHEQ